MGGKHCSNRASTTLPRTAITLPRFGELDLLRTFSAVYFRSAAMPHAQHMKDRELAARQ
jgi:hypothetical protein